MESAPRTQTTPVDVVYKQMRHDTTATGTGPGGHSGATLQSSADGPIPTTASSDKVTTRTRHRQAWNNLVVTPCLGEPEE
jgi:hypothetical protein